MERYFPFLTAAGLVYSESYEKQSDASCVFKYRFSRGSDYLEFRTVAGETRIGLVVCVGGTFRFPDLWLRHKQSARRFRLKHLFKQPTTEELWAFTAQLTEEELAAHPDLFGVLAP